MRGLQGGWLPMWLVVGSVAGCAHESTTYQDDLVHTDRPGHQQAHGHEPRLPEAVAMSSGLPSVKLPAGSRLVDLTHAFDSNTIYWPTEKTGFVLQEISADTTPGGWFYATHRFSAPEHGGTHMDAPYHFAQNGLTVDASPLAKLIAPAAVIDMRVQAEAQPDALLDVETIEQFEKQFGPIIPGTIVLVRTGWASRWPDRKRYLGDDKLGTAAGLHFPGISEAAAEALVKRKVAAVGIDTASVDHGPSKDFLAHRTLSANDIPAFENITHLDLLPPRGALILALPMKIKAGSGAPLRIVAVVPGATKTAKR
jgi:kynurenine formamidase